MGGSGLSNPNPVSDKMMNSIILNILAIGIAGTFSISCKGKKISDRTETIPSKDSVASDVPDSKSLVGRVWMKIDPVQCQGNPWDKYRSTEQDSEMSEESALVMYLGMSGISYYEYKSEQTHEFVCDACDCPRGDTVSVLVDEESSKVMMELGFTF